MKSVKMSWKYIAGFTDGEGSLAIYDYDNTKYGGTSKGKRAYVGICQKTGNDKVLMEISKFLRKHDMQHCFYRSLYEGKNHCKMTWIRLSHKTHVKKFLQKVLPYLIVKRKIGLKIIKFCDRK